MNTEHISLARLRNNPSNPRQITKEKFDRLLNSILVLPKMLELRPIVVDETLTVLGGNMRRDALAAIGSLHPDEIRERLASLRDFEKKPADRREALLAFWDRWLEDPSRPVPVIRASELSEAERREFVIKDNAAFGDWDWDALANEWDPDDLVEWGLDAWREHEGDTGEASEDDDFDEGTDVREGRVRPGRYGRSATTASAAATAPTPPSWHCSWTARRPTWSSPTRPTEWPSGTRTRP